MTGSPIEAESDLGLAVEHLSVSFRERSLGWGERSRTGNWKRVVDDVSFTVPASETLALVGESGAGKTTTALGVMRLAPSGGVIRVDGLDISNLEGEQLRRARSNFQMVFQNPYSSLDPRMSIGRIIAEPLKAHATVQENRDATARVAELLTMVDLAPRLADRFPHELSGGQRQRVGVARALAVSPRLVVCDEPVSSLDVSIQAQIINLLVRLQEQLSVTYLFISHDLELVRHIAHRTAVMYLGKIVERGSAAAVHEQPRHPYTIALRSAVPSLSAPTRDRIVLTGELEGDQQSVAGCQFRQRCWLWQRLGRPDLCRDVDPPLKADGAPEHFSACHFSDEA